MNLKRALTALILGSTLCGVLMGATACPKQDNGSPPSTASRPKASATPAPSKNQAKPAYPDVTPTSQAEVDKLMKKHPTALCENGAFTWVASEDKACKAKGEIGVGEWYGGRPA